MRRLVRDGIGHGRYLCWRVLPLVAALALAAVAAHARAQSESHRWSDYIGTQDQATSWSHTLRGVDRGRTGISARAAATAESRPATLPVTDTRVVIVPFGALPNPGQPGIAARYFKMIEDDDGVRKWIAEAEAQTLRVGKSMREQVVYWQIGNEINSRKYSANVGGESSSHVSLNDEHVIPVYAEQVLAPAVVAINAAVNRDPALESRTRIIAGTVAAAFKPSTRAWLLHLLDYTLRGSHVPSLAGKKVSQVTAVVGIHYLLSRDDASWRVDLNQLYAQVVKRRGMQGLWLTEELGKDFGRSGMGGAIAYKCLGRFLDWVYSKGLTPEQAQMNYWGWRLGQPANSAATALGRLYRDFGDDVLVVRRVREDSGQLETHGLQARRSGKFLLLAIANRRSRFDGKIRFQGVGGASVIDCRYLYRNRDEHLQCDLSGDVLSFSRRPSMPKNSVLMAVLRRLPDK